MGIVKKQIIGYFFIIVLPVIAFGMWWYSTSYNTMVEQYVKSKQQIFEQSYDNLKVQLTQMESAYQLFQYNTNVNDYLSGLPRYEGDYVYDFLKYIRPIYILLYFGNPHIKEISLYSNQPSILQVPPEIMSEDEFADQKLLQQINSLKPASGLWQLNFHGDAWQSDLRFYQKLYNKNFDKQVGFMEIKSEHHIVTKFITELPIDQQAQAYLMSNNTIVLAKEQLRSIVEEENERTDRLLGSEEVFYTTSKMPPAFIHALYLSEIGLRLIIIDSGETVFSNIQKQTYTLLAVLVALLMMLSYVYYLSARSISRRITKLARHMKRVDSNNLRSFTSTVNEKDEIGYLTTSYNHMLARVDELINKVQRAEIMRKEAEYTALQAQIKPHFLYNTIETIRMLAQLDGNKQVAELSFVFSKFIRYSISRHQEYVKIADELQHIVHYLHIHQTRIGGRMSFQITNDERIETLHCPKFILQPIVENCIVHALAQTLAAVHIYITCTIEADYAIVSISDNGPGMTEARLAEVKMALTHSLLDKDATLSESVNPSSNSESNDTIGIGLTNVHERINMYFGQQSGIIIEQNKGQGTKVTLKMWMDSSK
ncbi:sensor histidine kinase [Paenibacillus yanchengensis]|uniref:Sensor histidine kinase n=1 Tax=Paenibacillus yanchengensis TaxID=2035833 RepID=A0ABW4YJ89_9BACL